MLQTKFCRNRFAGFLDDLKGFNHIWAWRPSWLCDLDAARLRIKFDLIDQAV